MRAMVRTKKLEEVKKGKRRVEMKEMAGRARGERTEAGRAIGRVQ